jgi:hypothetical protein
MTDKPLTREVPDFSAYPDLVVMFLGMRVGAFYGLKTLLGLGPQIDKAGAAHPDGLLHYENNIIFSLYPLHIGMRWYWRDFESLDAWSRSEPHLTWFKKFMKESGGTMFWHETFFMRGGMEALYHDLGKPIGFATFLPLEAPRGVMATRIRARPAA